MTTTIASPAAGTPVLPVSKRSAPRSDARAKTRSSRTAFWIAVPVLIVAGAALFLRAWGDAGASGGEISSYTVIPRTFTVMLREKGELKAAKSTDIVCEVEGKSTIITLIPEGSQVKEGDMLVALASDQIEDRIRQEELKEANAITAFEASRTELEIQRDKNASDIRKAELDIELKKLELDKYEKGEWNQRRRDAEIAIEQAIIALDRARENFESSQKLYERTFITKTEYEQDEFSFKKAEWDLEKARNSASVLETYTHVADSRKLQSDVDEAIKECDRVKKNADAEETKKLRSMEGKEKELQLTQDQLAKFRVQRDKCRIVAPTQGFVVYSGGEGGGRYMMESNQIKEGATVFERQVLMQVPDTTEMLVVIRVHEAKTDKLRLGQQAIVEVEGLPGKQFSGRVSKIAVVADTQNRWLNPDLKEYETEVTLERTEEALKPGVTAHVQILVETITDQLAVPVQAVYSKGGKRFVFSQQRGEVRPVEIQLGATGTEWAEISGGISANDKVLLAFTDDHKRLIPEESAAENKFRFPMEAMMKSAEQSGTQGSPQGAPGGTREMRRRDGAPGGAPKPDRSAGDSANPKPDRRAERDTAKSSETERKPAAEKPASGAAATPKDASSSSGSSGRNP